ncbi:MAG: transposase [Thermodesulfobacteriota bacterium]|nr:transposase [Thermodesulfobacteriota bacterium]
MPRLARLDAPGVIHHAVIRGIDRKEIFRDNRDRDDMMDRLANLVPSLKTGCYAWAFLSNHAHFLFRSGDSGLSTFMRRLLTGYVVNFNRRHKRHGHLFQNRYKSIICQEDIYLKELVRYIHLNPLRAKLVSDMNQLNRYKYCGHGVLRGRRKCDWQDREYVLSFFGRNESEGMKEYNAYVKEGMDQGRRPELVGGGLIRSLGGWSEARKVGLKRRDRMKGDERILGNSDFVMNILTEANERTDRRYELKSLGYDLDKLEQRVLDLYQLEREELYSKSRQRIRSEARSVFCYWAVRELGVEGAHMAKLLMMSQAGIAYAVKRGENIVEDQDIQMIA